MFTFALAGDDSAKEEAISKAKHFLNAVKKTILSYPLVLGLEVNQKKQKKVSEAALTDAAPKVLIVDDSMYERNRSKKVELLARCFDHASQKMRFFKGLRMLTLG